MERTADFILIQFELSEGRLWPIAVLLFDPHADRLYVRCRNDFGVVPDAESGRVVQLWLSQLTTEAACGSGDVILRALEGTLSNAIRMSERKPMPVADFDSTLGELCARYFQ